MAFLYRPTDLLPYRGHPAGVRDISDGQVVLSSAERLKLPQDKIACDVWGVSGTWNGNDFRGFFLESGALYDEDETLPPWLENALDDLL